MLLVKNFKNIFNYSGANILFLNHLWYLQINLLPFLSARACKRSIPITPRWPLSPRHPGSVLQRHYKLHLQSNRKDSSFSFLLNMLCKNRSCNYTDRKALPTLSCASVPKQIVAPVQPLYPTHSARMEHWRR